MHTCFASIIIMPSPGTTYETKTGFGPAQDLFSPVWTLRLFPSLALLSLALALFAFRTGLLHNSCLLFAALLLGPVLRLAFAITSFTLRRPYDSTNVENLPITNPNA